MPGTEVRNAEECGRFKGGVKYNPLEVKPLVENLAAALQCAIAPVPDERLRERACCHVILRPGEALALGPVCDFLLGEGIAKFEPSERLEVAEKMPLTPTRKVIKGRLRPGVTHP